jgi:hypothetical protein
VRDHHALTPPERLRLDSISVLGLTPRGDGRLFLRSYREVDHTDCLGDQGCRCVRLHWDRLSDRSQLQLGQMIAGTQV